MPENSSDHVNISGGEASFNKSYFEPLYDGCLVALCLAVVCINALVLMLYTCRQQLRTKTNTLLVSLATSDLLMGLCGIPLYIACNAIREESVCIAQVVVYRFFAVSTMLHIFAVTSERYFCVVHPLQYITIVTRQRVMRAITTIWAISLFVALIQLSWVLPVGFFSDDSVKFTLSLVYHSVGVIVCFVLPFSVMVVIYSKMFIAIHRQVRQINRHSVYQEASTKRAQHRELRALVIFALMLGIFAGSWITWYISVFQVYIEFSFLPIVCGMIFDFLRVGVSFLNPLLYTFLKHDFREAFMSLFKGKMISLEISPSQSTAVNFLWRSRASTVGGDTHML